jgi:NTE family protein
MSKREKIPRSQRALVFQGGGALGAYEAGVFKALYKKLYRPGEALFDIVAGTSIGAINAAILVNHVIKHNNSWEKADEALLDFWESLSSPTPLSGAYAEFWLGEAGRRYYSVKEFFARGLEKVHSAPETVFDYKFHDYLPYFYFSPNVTSNTRYRYSNRQLRESISSFLPIATREGEPRLLTVAVDVVEGATVTFDSYPYEGKKCLICERDIGNDKLVEHVNREHGAGIRNVIRWSVYGDKENRHAIFYEDGIDVTHVIASATIPIFYDYEEIDGHKFWDGGILSNTPLRELIQAYRDYWYKDKGEKEPPDLQVYIVNMWPIRESAMTPPSDNDGLNDRRNDLLFHDKTGYDRKVAEMVSDYIDYINKLARFSEKAKNSVENPSRKNDLEKELTSIKQDWTESSKKRTGEKRRNYELTEGRFRLVNTVTIERTDDPNDISYKWEDLTSETIRSLVVQGYEDAKRALKMPLPPISFAGTTAA